MTLAEFELSVSQFLTPIIAIVVVLVVGIYIRGLANDIAEGLAFRRRGFRCFEPVEINDTRAIVISIGLRCTVFQMPNGTHIEYLSVPNSRLKFYDIKKLAPKLEESHAN